MRKSEYIKLNGQTIAGYSNTEEEKEFWTLLKENNIVNIAYADDEIYSITFSTKQKLILQKIKETLSVLEKFIYDKENNFSSIRVKEVLVFCGCNIQEIKSFSSENQYILFDENKAKLLYDDMDFLSCFESSVKQNALQVIEQQNIQVTHAENNSGVLHIGQQINNINEISQYISENLHLLRDCNVDQSIVNEFLENKDETNLRKIIENICLLLGAGESLVTLGPILVTLLKFFLSH